MQARLPGDGGGSQDSEPGSGGGFEGMVRSYMARLRGPLGCVFALLACTCLLPVIIVLFILNFGKLRAMMKAQRAAERGAPHTPFGGVAGVAPGGPDLSQAVAARAAAMLVRAMAIDESFTRDDVLQAGVAAGAGKSPSDVLDDAMRLGWIEQRRDGRLAVTDRGRAEAARLTS